MPLFLSWHLSHEFQRHIEAHMGPILRLDHWDPSLTGAFQGSVEERCDAVVSIVRNEVLSELSDRTTHEGFKLLASADFRPFHFDPAIRGLQQLANSL